MNRFLAVLLAGLILFAAGCTGGGLVLTRLQDAIEAPIDLPYPDSDTPTLELFAPAGEFAFTPGGEALVGGTITYNLEPWEPRSSTEGSTVRLEQSRDVEGVPPNDTRNEWTLALGTARPYSLDADLGAGSADLDLSGVPLTGFSFTTGAGDVNIHFDEANPQRIERFRVDAGAAQVTLSGLLNANFERLEVAGGAGQLEVYFDGGALAASSTADVRGATGEIILVIDGAAPIRVEPTTGVGELVVANDLIRQGDAYETASYGESDNRLDITVTVGVGRVRIETE